MYSVNSFTSLIITVLLGLGVLLFGCQGEEYGTDAKRSEPTGETPEDPPSGKEAFSMEQYAWSHRPLLVFAPSREDDRYLRQREMIEQNMDGFRDREMVFVEVFSSGASSKAGEQELTGADSDELRRKFDVGEDEFAVLLVGKDTTVKRRASEPVTADALFQQIDRMPMRRREMRQRSSNDGDTSGN